MEASVAITASELKRKGGPSSNASFEWKILKPDSDWRKVDLRLFGCMGVAG